MYLLALKTAAPGSWSRFYCTWEHPATVLSLHLEIDGVTRTTHPKGVTPQEMHRSFCSQEVPSRCSPVPGQDRHPPSIRLREVLCLSGQLKYSFNWATAPHQNLAHLYMTCIPESLWKALQINLAVYIQTSQFHNDWGQSNWWSHTAVNFTGLQTSQKPPSVGIQILSCGNHIPI